MSLLADAGRSGIGSCRLMGSDLSAADFRSAACANCLMFIYLIAPPYDALYHKQVCPNGLLVCAQDDDDCHCGNHNRVYNVPEFALNRWVSS